MFKLAGSIGFALALADLKRRIRHLINRGILGAIGAVFFLIGFCFLLVAVHLWLSAQLSPIASASIIGGVLVVVAVVFFAVAAMPQRARPRMPDASANPLGEAITDGMARLGDAVGSPQSALRNPVAIAAGIAIIAGFLLGRRSKRDKD